MNKLTPEITISCMAQCLKKTIEENDELKKEISRCYNVISMKNIEIERFKKEIYLIRRIEEHNNQAALEKNQFLDIIVMFEKDTIKPTYLNTKNRVEKYL
jgi:hypothetical protein